MILCQRGKQTEPLNSEQNGKISSQNKQFQCVFQENISVTKPDV